MEVQRNTFIDVEVQRNTFIGVEVQRNTFIGVEVQRNTFIDVEVQRDTDGDTPSIKYCDYFTPGRTSWSLCWPFPGVYVLCGFLFPSFSWYRRMLAIFFILEVNDNIFLFVGIDKHTWI